MSTRNNAFTIVLPADAQDGDEIPFVITTTFGNETTTKYFTIMVVTPIFSIANVALQNTNGTTSFAPGDMANVTVTYSNIGHSPLTNAALHLTSHYSLVTVNTPAQNISVLPAGTSATAQYQVSIGASVPDMTTVPLYVKCVVGQDIIVDTIYLTVGTVMETFETGNLTAFPWQTNNNPWFVTNEQAYAGNYCIRSKQDLADNDQSEFFSRSTAPPLRTSPISVKSLLRMAMTSSNFILTIQRWIAKRVPPIGHRLLFRSIQSRTPSDLAIGRTLVSSMAATALGWTTLYSPAWVPYVWKTWTTMWVSRPATRYFPVCFLTLPRAYSMFNAPNKYSKS